MKKQKSAEKKLSLKKLQLVKINQLRSIIGGGRADSLSMHDQTTVSGPNVRETIVTANEGIQN